MSRPSRAAARPPQALALRHGIRAWKVWHLTGWFPRAAVRRLRGPVTAPIVLCVSHIQHRLRTAPDLKRFPSELKTVSRHQEFMQARSERDRLAQVFDADPLTVDHDLHPGVAARDLDGALVGRDVDDDAEQSGQAQQARGDPAPGAAEPPRAGLGAS